jgi:hypothetical protein
MQLPGPGSRGWRSVSHKKPSHPFPVQKGIDFGNYIFRSGPIGKQFADALISRPRDRSPQLART